MDLPTPGSPLSSTTPPSTMPPPSTRSSSEMPVKMRLFSSVVLISERRFAVRVVTPSCLAAAACRAAVVPAFGASATTSSFIVFQLPQLGQRPIQRGLVSPQLEQTYTVFSFGSFMDILLLFHIMFFIIVAHCGSSCKKSSCVLFRTACFPGRPDRLPPHTRAKRERASAGTGGITLPRPGVPHRDALSGKSMPGCGR